MKSSRSNNIHHQEAVSSLIEYIQITAILMIFMVIILMLIPDVFINGPLNTLTQHAYVDIGNGVSTRIVDLYVISPYVGISQGLIVTDFDIPDEIAGRDYIIDILPPQGGVVGTDKIIISGNGISSEVSLAGIGSTLGVAGRTTSAGVNRICYNSTGGGCPE
jgi:hypothetical protein